MLFSRCGCIHVPIYFLPCINMVRDTHRKDVFLSGEGKKGEVKEKYCLFLLNILKPKGKASP